MPYSCPERQREAQAASYVRRYKSAAFRKAEAARKYLWFQQEAVMERNREKKAAIRLREKVARILAGTYVPPGWPRGKKRKSS